MARIRLDLPSVFPYSTVVPVRITDINYGAHLGNDALLGILHEARVRFLNHLGYNEQNIEGFSIIMSDAAIIYRSESFYGDQLNIQIAVGDFHTFGCDIFYKVSELNSGREVARAKTGIVFFDYENRKPIEVPNGFERKFRGDLSIDV